LNQCEASGHQRTEGRRRAKADGKMHRDELPDRRRHAGAEIAKPKDADAETDRRDDTVTVGDLAGQHAAGTEAQHHHGEGERGGATGRPEIRLHHRQHDHHRPHPDAAERADQDRHGKPGPCPTRIGHEQLGISCDFSRNSHGNNNLCAAAPRVKRHGAILGMQMRRDASPKTSFRGTRSVNPESRYSGFDAAHRPGMTTVSIAHRLINPFLTINWAKIAQ
jgi:hypothetical protein